MSLSLPVSMNPKPLSVSRLMVPSAICPISSKSVLRCYPESTVFRLYSTAKASSYRATRPHSTGFKGPIENCRGQFPYSSRPQRYWTSSSLDHCESKWCENVNIQRIHSLVRRFTRSQRAFETVGDPVEKQQELLEFLRRKASKLQFFNAAPFF